MTGESSEAIPGWYGKLPHLGDFASRRLPDAFIQPWDLWLQDVLHATRERLGAAWLDRYLTMPIWRFVLLPGLVGPPGWAGVLMPSVDRVGRQFPLTLAAALPPDAAAAHAVFRGASWFAGLEEAALGVLDPAHGPDDLDRALADRSLTLPGIVPADPSGARLKRLPSVEAFEVLAQAEAFRAWSREARCKSLWWTRGRMDGDPLMLACPALPTVEEFGWLLESRGSPATDSGTANEVQTMA